MVFTLLGLASPRPRSSPNGQASNAASPYNQSCSSPSGSFPCEYCFWRRFFRRFGAGGSSKCGSNPHNSASRANISFCAWRSSSSFSRFLSNRIMAEHSVLIRSTLLVVLLVVFDGTVSGITCSVMVSYGRGALGVESRSNCLKCSSWWRDAASTVCKRTSHRYSYGHE